MNNSDKEYNCELEKNSTTNESDIGLVKLFQETILALFLYCVSSKEELTINKTGCTLKKWWSSWFKRTFSKKSLIYFINNPVLKILKSFVVFLIIFIIFNLFIFIPIALKQFKSNSIYPNARAFLVSSETINRLYIFPLSKIFGYGNPLTWTFYPIKDYLYNTGISKIPKNDGEREIWWFNVRFVEFKVVVEPTLSDAYTYNDKTYVPLPQWQVRSFERWNQELYSHVKSWSDITISDPKLKKEKLMRFLDLVSTYLNESEILYTKLEITTKGIDYRKKDTLPPVNKQLANRYEEIIEIFNKLKAYSEKNEKDSYEYFQQKKKYEEEKFLYRTAYEIVRSRTADHDLKCEDPVLSVFAENHKKLRNYYVKHEKELKFGESATLEILITGGLWVPECNNKPEITELNSFFINRYQYYEKYHRIQKIN